MRPLSSQWVKSFRRDLLRWYDHSRRELPWRGISDPYRTWISEVMLQQTRVPVVLAYYERFLRRFPDVCRLARAPESAVLGKWSGLGYYRRARMLHRAAREIVRHRGGKLPESAAEWRELPGIGRYTAAAIASIALGEAVAVVDGNVERVLGRLLGLAHRAAGPHSTWWKLAEELLSRERPGDFNQAMMELGATLCLPGEPRCEQCPVARWCASRGGQAPRRSGAAARAAVPQKQRRQREVAYALTLRDGQVRLRRRAASEKLMPAMWELPAAKVNGARPAAVLKHSITTTDYRVLVFKGGSRTGEWVPRKRLSRLPLTGLTRKILKHFQVIQ